MNDWKQTQFGKEYDAFRQELDDYYAAYPTDVSALEQELDEKNRLQPQAGAMEKKTWIYELAAEKCRVKLFRHCPFYFEVDTGAPRNLAGSCFPPIPGLGSWLMRRDTSGLEQEFQNWIAPYVQEDALNSTIPTVESFSLYAKIETSEVTISPTPHQVAYPIFRLIRFRLFAKV